MKKLAFLIYFIIANCVYAQEFTKIIALPFDKAIDWTGEYVGQIKEGVVDEKTDEGYYSFGFGIGKETYYSNTKGVISVKNTQYPIIIDRSVWGISLKKINDRETFVKVVLLYVKPNEQYKKYLPKNTLFSSQKIENNLLAYLETKQKESFDLIAPEERVKEEIERKIVEKPQNSFVKIQEIEATAMPDIYEKPTKAAKEVAIESEKPVFIPDPEVQEIIAETKLPEQEKIKIEEQLEAKTPAVKSVVLPQKEMGKPEFIPETPGLQIPVSEGIKPSKSGAIPEFIPETPGLQIPVSEGYQLNEKAKQTAEFIPEKTDAIILERYRESLREDNLLEQVCKKIEKATEPQAFEAARQFYQTIHDLPRHRKVFDYQQQRFIQNYDYGTTGREEQTMVYMTLATLYSGSCLDYDTQKAIQYFEKAAQAKNVEAMMNLADYYEYRTGWANNQTPTQSPNKEKELFWLHQAASLEYLEAKQILNFKTQE